MLRLYSQEDIETLRLIKHLQDELGLNLAGVEVALHVFQRLLAMRRRILIEMEAEALRRTLEQEMEALFRLLDLPEP
jgi:DNA-binding transcriptional MerR regulator